MSMITPRFVTQAGLIANANYQEPTHKICFIRSTDDSELAGSRECNNDRARSLYIQNCCNKELIEWGEVEDSGQQALSE